MMRTQVDNQILVEMSEMAHLDRLRRILEILEAGDRPRFDFYAHEHPEEGRGGVKKLTPPTSHTVENEIHGPPPR